MKIYLKFGLSSPSERRPRGEAGPIADNIKTEFEEIASPRNKNL
jgi:hypothetical protein